MKVLLLGLLVLGSCGKESLTVINQKSEVNSAMENVTCHSDGSYTECAVINKAIKILSVNARRNEDCTQDVDYYLLNEKILVTRNNCRAVFLLEVENN